jgi:hypothetical protein
MKATLASLAKNKERTNREHMENKIGVGEEGALEAQPPPLLVASPEGDLFGGSSPAVAYYINTNLCPQ